MEPPTTPPVPGMEDARRLLAEWDPWVLDTQKALTAIPAPPFGEGKRGDRMAELLGAVGLVEIRKDEVGNVMARLPGDEPGPAFVLSAHLDTVFPAGTEVEPTESGGVIRAPGIADDGRGLAALLAVARVLGDVDIPRPRPLLFVATVGEEGPGDLRGVRHFFRTDGGQENAAGFISLDGVGLDRIINRGVGSTRLRITLKGPGGHSWMDWGLPNPIHALGSVVAELETLPLPTSPRTTATVARWGGGKSINAIPEHAWIEVDLRSEGPQELEGLEEALLRRCEKVLAQLGPSDQSDRSPVSMEVSEIGRRPAGSTKEGSAIVRASVRATEALGVTPKLISSSTDANVPMALGIPAITLGAGGRAGGIHTLGEWYSNEKGPEGILRALLTLAFLE